jgi:RNA polymerase-binding transcription factor DksA
VCGRFDPAKEVIVNEPRARELVARERARFESMLAELGGEILAEGFIGRQQPGDREDAGSARETESVTVALTADLREQLAAVGRAEERIARGTYGRSIESGISIPDERLEAEPLAERTVEEQRKYERRRPN